MLGQDKKMTRGPRKNLLKFFKQGSSKLKKGYSQDPVKQGVCEDKELVLTVSPNIISLKKLYVRELLSFLKMFRVRNSGCPVVQDDQKSSRTTKYESSEHFGCILPLNTRTWHKSGVISESTWILSAVMCVWLLTMPCGSYTVFKF